MKRRPFIDMRSIPKTGVVPHYSIVFAAAAAAIAFIDPLHFAIAGLAGSGSLPVATCAAIGRRVQSRITHGDLMKLLEEKIALLHG